MSIDAKNQALVSNYQIAFSSPAGQAVLADLIPFCRAAENTLVRHSEGSPIDVNGSLVLCGRREVFLRIQNFMNLTPDELYALARGGRLRPREKEDDNG